MTAAGAALALAALAGAFAATGAGIVVVASATLLLAGALVTGRGSPVFAAVLLLGAVYVMPEGDRAIPAPLYAGALLLTAELAFWSLDEREAGSLEPGAGTPRLLAILAVAATGAAAGALVLLASHPDTVRSPAATAAGLAAVLACIGVLMALARRHAPG